MNRTLTLLLLALAALLLSGCERTRFANAPAESTGCDPRLVGHWTSSATDDDDAGEVEAWVAGDCALSVQQNDKSPPRRSEGGQLRSARVGDADLLWIGAAWADPQFEIERDAITPAAGEDHDIYLYRWALDGDHLTLTFANDRALAHRMIDDKLKGEMLRADYELHVRVTADQASLQGMIARDEIFAGGRQLGFDRAKGP